MAIRAPDGANKGIRVLFFGLFTVKKRGGAVLHKETRKSRHIIAVACHIISSIRICRETPVRVQLFYLVRAHCTLFRCLGVFVSMSMSKNF